MTEIAGIYGNSLYDLAVESEMTDLIQEQMQQIRQIFRENPQYLKILQDPSLAEKERIELMEMAFGAQAERYLVNFLKLLCERNILTEYGSCCEVFTKRYYADQEIAQAVVTSAIDLTEEQQEALKKKLQTVSGKKILLTLKKDPAVLAGVCVELEGKVFDGTVHSRMAGLSKRLSKITVP